MRAFSAGYLLLVLAAIVYYRTTATHIFQHDLAFGIYGVVVAIYLLTRFGLSLAYRPHPDAGLEPSIAIVMCLSSAPRTSREWLISARRPR